ncbi:hypothetical protein KTJ32_17875 [Acinetobacter gyllenbergii]|uniref:hypothetical protein n=1 Tax=Acinetobacter gyllenbergii TaxID=134534 RepID=UPI0021D331EF|nr:hypothetical protein [Acinetobacter gyllenbergii]MCU4582867.1 hypothetical protein [Acinetobacter gyllenbergii]
MKAQPLAQELLDELTALDECVLLSEFSQYRYLMKCDKVIRVDAAEGYMCKGVVYAYSNDFEKMFENFQIALRLAPRDELIRNNYIYSMNNFGRFDEIIEIMSRQKNPHSSSHLHALIRALISTLNLEVLKEIDSSYVNKIEEALNSLNLEFKDVQSYILLFNSLMSQKNVRFGVVPSISWEEENGELFVYYDFVGNASESMKIMDEFDAQVFELNLKHVSRKLTLILLPHSVC